VETTPRVVTWNTGGTGCMPNWPPPGDFRRGSISETYRRRGKPNCACAQPDHPRHGPRYLWTCTVAGRGTLGRQLSADEVDKLRAELANYQRFATESRSSR
jgi:hypothetical protein